mmetsp:Transcript_20791/g.60499  ORF Transcript_20791/g.60499 Transcript_20791/m.60499 type:complete len:88 (-) Transcript_20791:129-392(-)
MVPVARDLLPLFPPPEGGRWAEDDESATMLLYVRIRDHSALPVIIPCRGSGIGSTLHDLGGRWTVERLRLNLATAMAMAVAMAVAVR